MPLARSHSVLSRQKAMTLLEMLMVVAILGLIAVMLIRALMPDDNLRCRLEAERLATYLASASNEAKMGGSTVKALFTFSKYGDVKRQITEIKVDSLGINWTDDKRAKLHQISKPIRLSQVETKLGGVKKEGHTFILFKGNYSPGGVAVIQLKKVQYSVVVPSNGNPPFVEKGIAQLPKGKDWKKQAKFPLNNKNTLSNTSPSLPNIAGGSSNGSNQRASSASPAQNPSPTPDSLDDTNPPSFDPPSNPPTPPVDPSDDDEEDPFCGDGVVNGDEECDDRTESAQCNSDCTINRCGDGVVNQAAQEECDDGNQDNSDACPDGEGGSCKNAICGDGFLRMGRNELGQLYEECEPGTEGEMECHQDCKMMCQTDADCQRTLPDGSPISSHGAWSACDLRANMPSSNTCLLEVPTFVISSISSFRDVTGKEADSLLTMQLNTWLNDSSNSLKIAMLFGVFEAPVNTPIEIRQVEVFQAKSTGYNIEQKQNLPSYRYQVQYCGNDQNPYCYQSSEQPITIYIPKLNYNNYECAYNMLQAMTSFNVSAQPNTGSGHHNATLSMTFKMNRKNASTFPINFNGENLEYFLDQHESTLECGSQDGWEFTLSANATSKTIENYSYVSESPIGCEEGMQQPCYPRSE